MTSVFFQEFASGGCDLNHHAIEKGHSNCRPGKQNFWTMRSILNEISVQVPLHHVLMLGKYIQSRCGFPRCFLLGQGAECAVNHKCVQVSLGLWEKAVTDILKVFNNPSPMSWARAGFMEVQMPLKKLRPKWKAGQSQAVISNGSKDCTLLEPPPRKIMAKKSKQPFRVIHAIHLRHERISEGAQFHPPRETPFQITAKWSPSPGLKFLICFERTVHTEFPGSWLHWKVYAECCWYYKLQAQSYCVQLLRVDK